MFSHPKSFTSSRIKIQIFLSLILLFLLLSPQATLAATPQVLPTVGLVASMPDGGNVFTQMARDSLAKAVTDGLVTGKIYSPDEITDFTIEKGLDECVFDVNDLCISVDFYAADATMNAAIANPTVNFLGIDQSWEETAYPTNLRGTYFAIPEAAYLAGTLAGLMTTSNRIGTVGGMSIDPVNDFIFPYTYGAQWANHTTISFVDYANDFTDETLGASIAQEQIDRGADVIYGVGGQMGNGAIKKAAELGKYVIGVDTDAFVAVFNSGTVTGSDLVLTSVLKKVDVAVYSTIEDQIGGSFTSGTKVYNLNNNGVGLAPFHDSLPSIPQSVLDQLKIVEDGIKAGTIDVWQPFFTDTVFLPMIIR